MAQALSIPQQSNQVVDVSKALANLVPLFFGSSTTATQVSQVNPVFQSQMQALIDNLVARGGDQQSALIQDIMTRAAQEFAPVIGAERAAGAYNSTVKKQLADEFMARAVSASSNAVLDNQLKALTAAAQLSASAANASKTTQTTQKTPATLPLGGSLLATAAGVGGNYLIKRMLAEEEAKKKAKQTVGKTGARTAADSVADVSPFVAEDAAAAQAANVITAPAPGVAPVEGIPFGFEGSTSVLDGSAALNFADTFTATGVDTAASAGASASAATEGLIDVSGLEITAVDEASAAAFAGSEAAGFGAEEALFGAGVGAGAAELGTAAVIGEGLGASTAGGIAAGVGAAAEGLALEEVALAVALWVICTELKRGGELDAKLYEQGAAHISRLSPHTINGYHFWAIPYTRLMRRSNAARKFITPWARGRTLQLSGKWNILGFITVALGEPICYLLGRILQLGPQNWQQLYPATTAKGN